MITIIYHKTCKPITLLSKATTPNRWSYIDLEDGRTLITSLYIRDDKGNDFAGVWFIGMSNPLTQLRNNRIEVRRGAYGSPVNGLHD